MSKTLLLADDSVTIQKVVGISFANEDVVLVTVDNGDDAIAKAREVRPDIVLADVVMPGKTGYDVCQTLKEDAQLSHIPVLLLTGTFEAFDEARASAVGADGHITKPFEAQALVDTVNARLAAAQPAPAPTSPPVASGEPFDFLESDAAPLEDLSGSSETAAPMIMGNDLGSSDAAFSFDQVDGSLAPVEPPDLVPAEGAAPHSEGMATNLFESPEADDDNARTKLVMSAEDELANATTLPPRAAEAATSEDSISDLGGTPEPTPAPSEAALSLEADAGDFGADLDLGATDPEPSQPFADTFDASAGVDPLADTEGEADAVFDPSGARDFDVASADLAEPAEAPAASLEPEAAPIAAVDPMPVADAPSQPEVSIQELDVPTLEPAVPDAVDAGELSDPGPFAQPMAAETGIAAEPILEAPAEIEAIGLHEPADDEPAIEPLPDPEPEPALEVETLAESMMHDTPAPTLTESPTQDLSPLMREQLHEALEKVAWETFGDVAERIVQDALARVEEVAWEVIPKMAEALIQEEIRKMKGSEED